LKYWKTIRRVGLNDNVTKIKKYFKGTLNYPLFIVIQFDEYKDILQEFASTKKIKVSDYCIDVDKGPDIDKLYEDIKKKTGTYLLLGLGNFIASKMSIAHKVIMMYKDLVLPDNCRIAVLLSANMYQEIKKINDNDPRVRNRIILPKTIPISYDIKSNELVYGIRAYLEACEKGIAVESVKSKLNIENVNVVNPENAYDELKHQYPEIFNKLNKSVGTKKHWAELLDNLINTKQTPLQYLSSQGFASFEYIFFNYAKKNDYDAWLFFINLKLNTRTNSYIGYVASKTEKLSDLFNVAKTAILDVVVSDKNFNNFYKQRKTMLINFKDADMADFIPKIEIKEKNKIAYLTDNTLIERKAIIEALCDGASDSFLPSVYPDLYHYLNNYAFEDEQITEYFKQYKKCKIKNIIDEDFIELVAKNAEKRPYNSLPSRSSLISGLDDGNTLLLYLDAFGVEYLGYVMEKCAELKLRFMPKVARAELPTITSYNRSFFDDWNGKRETPIKDLDDLKHHPERGYDYNNSPYPIHLTEELDVVKDALERAYVKLHSGECSRVVITSDHGASRLAVIGPDVQIHHNNCEPKSNGRYCVGDDLPSSDSIVREAGKKYAIIADYSRFKGSRTASVETHGGATLEEVLIPVIALTLADSNIQVSLENSVIETSFKVEPTLVVFITPDCDNVTAIIAGTNYVAEKIGKSKFKVIMPKLAKGKHIIDVFESKNKLSSLEFTVKSKGFTERNLF
jgi:hypothetical protein